MCSFDLHRGFLIPPYLTFPPAPLRSRTVGFPESGSDRGLYPHCLPSGVRLKCWPIYAPLLRRFACKNRPVFNGSAILGSASKTIPGPPRAQSPFARIEALPLSARCLASRQRALPLLLRSYGLMRQSIHPPASFGSRLVVGSLQVVTSPCWVLDLPGVISADPSLGVWTRTPVGSHGALARFFPWQHRSSPSFNWIDFPTLFSRKATSHGGSISGLQPFRYVQTPRFARHPGRSHHSFPLGGCDFSIRASHGSSPHHAPDMLNVRTGQLTFGDFHPTKSAALPAAHKTLEPDCLSPFLCHYDTVSEGGELHSLREQTS